jgi:hypothetical protein
VHDTPSTLRLSELRSAIRKNALALNLEAHRRLSNAFSGRHGLAMRDGGFSPGRRSHFTQTAVEFTEAIVVKRPQPIAAGQIAIGMPS